MDLETENRIAAMLLKEAAELRRQAEKEGVEVYLRQPKPRGRPNSRFLTATVLGVQQANRNVEENEMWRSRQKELELDNHLRRRTRDEDSGPNRLRDSKESGRTSKRRHAIDGDIGPSCSSRKRMNEDSDIREDEGLRDEEVDEFLHSRIKRGRGAVGSRMDETGPYLPSSSDIGGKQSITPLTDKREWQEKHIVLGPEKSSSISECSEDESDREMQMTKKVRSNKEHSGKHKSKEKSRSKDKKKKKRERKEKKRSSKHWK